MNDVFATIETADGKHFKVAKSSTSEVEKYADSICGVCIVFRSGYRMVKIESQWISF